MFKGKRTYLIAALMVILGGLKATGLLSEEVYKAIMALLAPLGLATLRSSVTTEAAKNNP